MIKRFLLFLIINFSALAAGGLFTKAGVQSDWYENFNKAPWSPPGYMFGVAWSVVMICFAVYMALIFTKTEQKTKIIILFLIQWILNIGWNPIFFYFHKTTIALATIVTLTMIIGLFLVSFSSHLKWKSLWISPYLIWLIIATSLNAYIVFKNA